MNHLILSAQPSASLGYALDTEGYLNSLNDNHPYVRYDIVPLRNLWGADGSVVVQATIRDQSSPFIECRRGPFLPASLVLYHIPLPASNPVSSVDPQPTPMSIHQAALLLFSNPSSALPERPASSRCGPLARFIPFRRCSLVSLSQGSLYDLRTQTDIHIPRSLHCDSERSILLTSQWGSLRPLSLIFGEIFDQITLSRVRTADRSAARAIFATRRVVSSFFRLLGERLGSFLAKMHDPHIIKQLQLSTNAPSPRTFASAEAGRQRLRGEIAKWRNYVQHMALFVDSPDLLDSFCRTLNDDADRQYFPDY
ncbi:uncharacterized protein PV07_04580 [Cladophialophora immunda]|uniref:Uncharacterized protein n=1 Tax=Cladophialophora immunda TaxID=569365 RepID=A0A0D2CT51_9EURO|nr:uncharacterized protein PV07_04580 [Cladophialophora immunda]KIW33085.1 hypothetical protein PV07_04580 [Cladophialophora immunda]